MARPTTFLSAAAALLLLGGALAGCASGGVDAAASSSPSTAEDLELEAAWLDGGSKVAVLAWGSSSCVPTVGDVAYESGVLSVALTDPPADQACTRDYVLRGVPVALPEGVDPSEDLRIEVSGSVARGDVELEGVAGLVSADGLSNGGLPTAGWTDADGIFALLTWGSSGCRPTVQDAAVAAPGEIAVTFAEPPADQVCTMDFGPRVTVIGVQDADDDASYELVLQGEGFDGTRIPIVGSN